ncbi:hypothetical protein [Priestia megaterium]|uniref:hypothetical protein n=1 Tax=Priestia megaterium TaxID=1404 RepID=UPI003CC57786
MKIENISEGQIFKNYKELCKELEIPVKSSNSKKAQFSELSRYCKFVKVGHSIHIHEVYDQIIDKIETRGRKNIYGDMVQLLIADILAKSEDHVVTLSRNSLLRTINMINKNYGFCIQHVKQLSKLTEIEEAVIYDFYNNSNNSLKQAIESALKNLEKRCVIWYERVMKVALLHSSNHRLATDEEKTIIMEAKKETLKKLGYTEEDEVLIRKSKDYGKFKKGVEEIIKEKSDISYYYNAYKIGISQKYIKEERDKLIKLVMDDYKRITIQDKLNDTVVENFKSNAENRHDNAANSISKMAVYRVDCGYPNKINQLVDILIDDDQSDIYKDIMEIHKEEQEFEQLISCLENDQLFA